MSISLLSSLTLDKPYVRARVNSILIVLLLFQPSEPVLSTGESPDCESVLIPNVTQGTARDDWIGPRPQQSAYVNGQTKTNAYSEAISFSQMASFNSDF